MPGSVSHGALEGGTGGRVREEAHSHHRQQPRPNKQGTRGSWEPGELPLPRGPTCRAGLGPPHTPPRPGRSPELAPAPAPSPRPSSPSPHPRSLQRTAACVRLQRLPVHKVHLHGDRTRAHGNRTRAHGNRTHAHGNRTRAHGNRTRAHALPPVVLRPDVVILYVLHVLALPFFFHLNHCQA